MSLSKQVLKKFAITYPKSAKELSNLARYQKSYNIKTLIKEFSLDLVSDDNTEESLLEYPSVAIDYFETSSVIGLNTKKLLKVGNDGVISLSPTYELVKFIESITETSFSVDSYPFIDWDGLLAKLIKQYRIKAVTIDYTYEDKSYDYILLYEPEDGMYLPEDKVESFYEEYKQLEEAYTSLDGSEEVDFIEKKHTELSSKLFDFKLSFDNNTLRDYLGEVTNKALRNRFDSKEAQRNLDIIYKINKLI